MSKKQREFAVRIDWSSGEHEIVPAKDSAHADLMVSTIYRGQRAVVVQRKVSEWEESE